MRQNNEIDWTDYAFLTGCIAYFVIPTDLIPDFVVGLGYTDDIAVLALALKNNSSLKKIFIG